MMKTIAILFSFLFCINLNAQKGKLFLSTWHEDGKDYRSIPPDKYSYFNKGKLYYFISNDHANIYLYLKTADPEAQLRILKDGLTIWVNMDTKLNRKMGIRFPLGSQNSGTHKKTNISEEKTNIDGNVAMLLPLANKIELIGFTNEEARHFPSENRDNFRGSVSLDNEGNLNYRMIMPIEKLPVRNSKDGKGAMPFILGIEYGTMPEQKAFPQVLLWIKNVKLATDR
jgi:hypothetical protein